MTLLVHLVMAAALLLLSPEKKFHRAAHPLEVTFLTPPQVIPPKPPPPPPPRPKEVKPEPKPVLQPPIEPPVPEPPPQVVSEEPPLPVAPPLPRPAPVELPVVPPEYNAAHLRNPPPPYPPIAKRLRLEGTVRVRVLVSPAGLPQQIELARTSGVSVLDEAALKAVRNWAFIPARRGTEPIAAWVEIPINFHLKQDG
jgi:protein TonB